MFYQLPPAGNPVRLARERHPHAFLEEAFSPYRYRLYGSGTAALAGALMAAIKVTGRDRPQVLMPAYGCPDLVAAAVYAGAQPVLVDLEAMRPWMALEGLPDRADRNACAVIVVDLLGLPERKAQIPALTKEMGVPIIQDSAQAFPTGDGPSSWWGDLVVLSFGRGKPVGLLGGGAVLYRDAHWAQALPIPGEEEAAGWMRRARFMGRALAYNVLSTPRFYWLPGLLPFLHLGETRYRPLPGLPAMSLATLEALPANVRAYGARGGGVQEGIAAMLEATGLDAVIDLPRLCCRAPWPRLLRYPLLVPQARRGPLYQALAGLGLGASTLYPAPLPRISGLTQALKGQGPFPGAEDFARRLITLPTHGGVTERDMARMGEVLLKIVA